MDYFILTNTEFFRQVIEGQENSELLIAYRDFIQQTYNLYSNCSNYPELLFVMTYTEIELQGLHESYRMNADKKKEPDVCCQYTRKALLFIHRTLVHIQSQVPPLSVSTNSNHTPVSPNYQWTGSVVELVEIIYGFIEMRSINHGETPINELAGFIGSQFGIEIKDCYSAYVDMKRRKNDSRTYYLDKMKERLNRRMELDDEGERMRK